MNKKKKSPITCGTQHTVVIEDITQKGQGVCRIEGMTVFVNGGVPGDHAEILLTTVKSNYGVGEIIHLIEASPHRCIPDCPYVLQCGGCQMGHVSYASQLTFKQKQVEEALIRIGGIEDVRQIIRPILGMDRPVRYRNKAQYKLDKEGVGFYAWNTHDIVAIEDCLNQPESCRAVIAFTKALVKDGIMLPYNERTHKGNLRGVVQRTNRRGDEMITLIVTKDDPSLDTLLTERLEALLPALKSFNINVNTTTGNVIFGKTTRCVYGIPTITEQLGDLVFDISPRSFFQVNTTQAEVLYDQVKLLADLNGSQVVYDLFCGTGTIGLYLADKARKVVGIEVIPEAIEDAKANAVKNGIDNAVFYCGKAESLLAEAASQNELPDLVVVDPPRKGIDAHIIDLISEYGVPKVIYVSCNPATLARDVARFRECGYILQVVQPVDLFPGTGHIESVVLLSKAQKQGIEIRL